MNTPVGGIARSDDARTVVLSAAGLSSGDLIEASYKGTLVHRGEVTDIAPNHDLFWISDYLTGSRRLLDVTEFKIIRIPAPGTMPAGPATIQ